MTCAASLILPMTVIGKRTTLPSVPLIAPTRSREPSKPGPLSSPPKRIRPARPRALAAPLANDHPSIAERSLLNAPATLLEIAWRKSMVASLAALMIPVLGDESRLFCHASNNLSQFEDGVSSETSLLSAAGLLGSVLAISSAACCCWSGDSFDSKSAIFALGKSSSAIRNAPRARPASRATCPRATSRVSLCCDKAFVSSEFSTSPLAAFLARSSTRA